jgi:RNA polymerase sigma-70 factor (ECF subfamily)
MAHATVLAKVRERPAGDDDRLLVERFQRGDDSAFDTLVGRHEEFVYNICLGILNSTDDADDAVQETFLAAYRALKKFRGDSKVSTWLYRIAVRECLDISRRRKRSSSLDEIVNEPSVGDGADDRALAGMVRATLDELPAHYRSALVLRYYGGLSYEEIAEAMGSTPGRVKMMLHRARRAFQNRWPEEG